MFMTIGIIFVVSAILMFYFSAVVFTAVRAYEHHVKFSVIVLFMIPITLVKTHIHMYNSHKFSDRKKAFKMLMFIFKKYPVALAMFLTIIATNVAEQNIQLSNGVNDKKSHHTRQKKRKNAIDRVLRGNEYGDLVYGI